MELASALNFVSICVTRCHINDIMTMHGSAMPYCVGYVLLHMQLLKRIREVVLLFFVSSLSRCRTYYVSLVLQIWWILKNILYVYR